MEPAHIAHSLAVLALGFAACGGTDTHMRPEIPSDLTTTTGAPTATPAQASRPPAAPVRISEPAPVADDRSRDARSFDKSGSPLIGAQPMTSSSWDDSARNSRGAEGTFTDSEIVAVVDAAGWVERQLARDAVKRAKNPRVRQLAQRVLSDHGEAKLERVERTASLSPADNATSAELKSNVASAVQSLRASRDDDYDQLYVDALAGEERRFMDLLDHSLIPQTQNQDLRALLQDLRTSASSRLGMAESAGAH